MNDSAASWERVRARPVLGHAILAAAAAAMLAGCGDDAKKDKPATQVAARVNKEELSVHQINQVLVRQQGVKPQQAEAAGRQILERLIDQELALQKAEELKIHRDQKVVQQIEAARRDIIARAYAERIGEQAQRATPEEVRKYYDEHPALFKERRIYSLQEIAIEAQPEQIDDLRAKLKSAKSAADFAEYLKSAGYRHQGTSAVRGAEQLPLARLREFAALKDGQAVLTQTPTGAQVIYLAQSRSEPIDAARAAPAIEQFLLNDRRRDVIVKDMKALRAGARIEYVGKYAQGAAEAASAAAAARTAEPAEGAASGIDAATIMKGLGIK